MAMKRMTQVALLLAALGVATLPITTEAAVRLPDSTAHGANFVVKSLLDTNFCIEVASGSGEGRSLTMQQCSSVDTQRWMLTWGSNGLNEMVDTQGMCVDVKGRKVNDGIAVVVVQCHHNRAEAVTFTSSGLLDFKSGGCLSIGGAANDAMVSLATCDETKNGQLWKLTH
jgi:hypothetical protein